MKSEFLLGICFCTCGLTFSAHVAAGEFLGYRYSGNSIFRIDVAASTTSEINEANHFGNPYNSFTVQRVPGNPGLPTDGIPIVGDLTTALLPPYSVPLPLLGDSFQRPLDRENSTFNYHVARFDGQLEVELGADLRFVGRARALYNLAEFGASFDPRKYENAQGGLESPLPDIYGGRPNQFDYQVIGSNNPQPLEFSGRDYFVDFPALLLEYRLGAAIFRLGNQQIAWGQTIFFRVLDKVNGLDLRRHLIIDRALEEFSDKRVPALGLRATAQLTSGILADAFINKFQPTIFPNPNTPYSIIPAQFTVHDRYVADGYDRKLNYGLRLKGDYGQWGWQAMYMHRYNPAGVFRWTESGVNRNFPNDNLLGATFNTYCATALGSSSGGCGDLMERMPFSVHPAAMAVGSGNEIAYYAQSIRLNGQKLLNNVVRDFPAAEQLLAREVDSHERFLRQLDAFFLGSGGLRGHIARDYYRENVFGVGASYVTEAEMGSFFNQVIMNVELAYTPDKSFSDIGAAQKPIVEDEWEASFVAEKYHRFFESIPSTLLAVQYMFRSASDMFDRHLSGYGGSGNLAATPSDSNPPGRDNAQYVAAILMQPTAAYIHELSVAVLADLGGGMYIQPGYRWKPRGNMTVELFYNYVDGDAFGKKNDNALSSIDYADELTLRLSYGF